MPAFVLNTFGAARMPVLYGCILTAWSAAGIVGPQAIAWLKDQYGLHAAGHAFALGAGLMALGFLFSLFLTVSPRSGKNLSHA
jgi:OFA family oxalate/formate antiporter-like MFS transporter